MIAKSGRKMRAPVFVGHEIYDDAVKLGDYLARIGRMLGL